VSPNAQIAVLVTLLVPAVACATGPVDSLTGNWQQRSRPQGYALTLHQTGTAVTGFFGDAGCAPTVPVTGSLRGADVEIAFTAPSNGDSLTMRGRFLDPSTLTLVLTVNQTTQGGSITLDKVPSVSGFICNGL
jgi:hypothetical protein